jgi:hypothetical protein
MIGGVSMKHLGQYLFSHSFVGELHENTQPQFRPSVSHLYVIEAKPYLRSTSSWNTRKSPTDRTLLAVAAVKGKQSVRVKSQPANLAEATTSIATTAFLKSV